MTSLRPDQEMTGHTLPVGGDYLEYIADMVLELQAMADRSGENNLAIILRSAHREATQRAAAQGIEPAITKSS